MFGAMIGILFGLYVILTVINVIGVVIGAVFSGALFLLAKVFSGEGIAAAATRVVVAKNRTRQSLISCEIDKDVEEARAVCPGIAINYLTGARGEALKKVIQHTIDLKCQFIQFQSYDADDIAKLKAAGIKINYFGTDDPDKLRTLMKDGVDFPLADRFTDDWPVFEQMGGYKLNELPKDYVKSVENLK